jgi:hypothetical protein
VPGPLRDPSPRARKRLEELVAAHTPGGPTDPPDPPTSDDVATRPEASARSGPNDHGLDTDPAPSSRSSGPSDGTPLGGGPPHGKAPSASGPHGEAPSASGPLDGEAPSRGSASVGR